MSFLRLTTLAIAGVLLLGSSLQAGLIVSVQNVSTTAGSSNVGLDVVLTNNGIGAVEIGGFSFELTVGSSDITFVDVTTGTTTSPYIFGALGVAGPNIGFNNSGQGIQAADAYSLSGMGNTLAAGASVGLGHLVLNVSNSASGVYGINLVPFPSTSLANFTGDDVPVESLVNGSVTVGASAVPEPTTLFVAGLGALAVGFRASRRKRRESDVDIAA